MPSSPKLPKEKILKAALDLLIRDGYAALNIKTLAKELDCSTQPISWHFGNMEGLRREFSEYALSYASQQMQPAAENGFEAFSEVGNAYINLAFDTPNLFRYLYMDGSSGCYLGGLDALSKTADNQELIESIAQYFGITPQKAADYVGNTIIYTHGILTFVVAGVIKGDKKQVRQMVDQAGYAFLMQAGAAIEAAKKLHNAMIGENE